MYRSALQWHSERGAHAHTVSPCSQVAAGGRAALRLAFDRAQTSSHMSAEATKVVAVRHASLAP
eukprot:4655283-Prymnesium_polylepis.1